MANGKQVVTLGKIVDVGGTVYGPGEITVPLHIAERLIKYHDAQPGKMVQADVADILHLPADRLTAKQLQLVLEHKQKATTAAAAPVAATPPPAGQTPAPTSELPDKFPARAKLIALGLDTLDKVRNASADELATLTQTDRDKVKAELATGGS